MTLNSSGPISLGGTGTNASINLELGLSATAQISLNDTAVRTLANVASGAIIMPTNFYGKSNFLDQQTVTTGDNGSGPPDRQRGFSYGSFGSIVDGTSNIYSGALVNRLLWREDTGVYVFELNGSNANSGWTTLTIVGNGTVALTRASASYYNSGVSTQWTWSTAASISTQVFGSISSTAVCTFT
jgi:hypothetical protein